MGYRIHTSRQLSLQHSHISAECALAGAVETTEASEDAEEHGGDLAAPRRSLPLSYFTTKRTKDTKSNGEKPRVLPIRECRTGNLLRLRRGD